MHSLITGPNEQKASTLINLISKRNPYGSQIGLLQSKESSQEAKGLNQAINRRTLHITFPLTSPARNGYQRALKKPKKWCIPACMSMGEALGCGRILEDAVGSNPVGLNAAGYNSVGSNAMCIIERMSAVLERTTNTGYEPGPDAQNIKHSISKLTILPPNSLSSIILYSQKHHDQTLQF